MKKNIFLIILSFFILPFSLSAKTLKVVASTQDLASIAKEIGKEKIKVEFLCPGFKDPHFVEPLPSQVLKLKKADLVLLVGMELDIWMLSLIDAARNPKIRYGKKGYLDCSLGIEKLEVPQGKIDASMGHLHPYGNPHYWVSPLNAKIIAKNIKERLCQLLPQDCGYFERNLKKFSQKIDKKFKEWKEKLDNFKNKKVVTYHKSWCYFARDFDLKIVGELEPKPGIPPSYKHLKALVELMKRENVKVILQEIFYPKKAGKFLSEKTNAKLVIVPNSVGGTKEAKDYFSLIDTIVNKLADAFKNAKAD